MDDNQDPALVAILTEKEQLLGFAAAVREEILEDNGAHLIELRQEAARISNRLTYLAIKEFELRGQIKKLAPSSGGPCPTCGKRAAPGTIFGQTGNVPLTTIHDVV